MAQNPYAKYAEAKKAVKRLKIKSQTDYMRRCKRDKRLTTHPHRTYAKKGWVNWYDFFGKAQPNFYKNYKQAEQAARKLKFTSSERYKKYHSKDPRLPSHPDEFYRGKGWCKWRKFFGTEKKK